MKQFRMLCESGTIIIKVKVIFLDDISGPSTGHCEKVHELFRVTFLIFCFNFLLGVLSLQCLESYVTDCVCLWGSESIIDLSLMFRIHHSFYNILRSVRSLRSWEKKLIKMSKLNHNLLLRWGTTKIMQNEQLQKGQSKENFLSPPFLNIVRYWQVLHHTGGAHSHLLSKK